MRYTARSPNLRDGDKAIEVFVSEAPRFARGGSVKRGSELKLSLSPEEFRYLKSQWGEPRKGAKGFEYQLGSGFRQMVRKATGGTVEYHPKGGDEASYYTYGEGPEYQHFTRTPGAPLTINQGTPDFPRADTSGMAPSGRSGLQTALGAVTGLGSLAAGAADLGEALGYNPEWLQTVGTYGRAGTGNLDAIKDIGARWGIGATHIDPAIASGAAGNQALQEYAASQAAGNAGTAATTGTTAGAKDLAGALGSAYGVYSGIEQGGTEGAINAGLSGASLASNLGATGTLGAVGAVAPIAMAMFAGADLINNLAGNNKPEPGDYLLAAIPGAKNVVLPARGAGSVIFLPDGRMIGPEDINRIGNAVKSKDQAAYERALAEAGTHWGEGWAQRGNRDFSGINFLSNYGLQKGPMEYGERLAD